MKDPDWSRKTVQILKHKLNLSVDQIYKWGYDRKLALQKDDDDEIKIQPPKAKKRKKQKVELQEVRSGPERAPRIQDYNGEVDQLFDYANGELESIRAQAKMRGMNELQPPLPPIKEERKSSPVKVLKEEKPMLTRAQKRKNFLYSSSSFNVGIPNLPTGPDIEDDEFFKTK